MQEAEKLSTLLERLEKQLKELTKALRRASERPQHGGRAGVHTEWWSGRQSVDVNKVLEEVRREIRDKELKGVQENAQTESRPSQSAAGSGAQASPT